MIKNRIIEYTNTRRDFSQTTRKDISCNRFIFILQFLYHTFHCFTKWCYKFGTILINLHVIQNRREIQDLYNKEHGIVPKTIKKNIRDSIEATMVADEDVIYGIKETDNIDEIKKNIESLSEEMMEAAQNLQFERAAELRDKIKQLEERIKE